MTPELNEMVAVLMRAGWDCGVAYYDFLDGTAFASLIKTENGRDECVVCGEGVDNESAERDLLRKWAAGKGTAPAASSPEELEIKIASLNLNGRAARIF